MSVGKDISGRSVTGSFCSETSPKTQTATTAIVTATGRVTISVEEPRTAAATERAARLAQPPLAGAAGFDSAARRRRRRLLDLDRVAVAEPVVSDEHDLVRVADRAARP